MSGERNGAWTEAEWRALREEQRVLRRVLDFIMEDDEVFFYKMIDGLNDDEIEEYLTECPEFRKYWKGPKM